MMWDRPTKIALAGMLVLAATVAAALLLPDGEASPPTPPAEAPSTPPGSMTQAADAAVAAGTKAATSIDDADTQRIAQATTDAATLCIHLRGVDAEVPWTTPLRVRIEAKIGTARNRTEWRLRLPVDRDVAKWSAPVPRDEFDLVALEVTADDDGYFPASEHLRAKGESLP